MPLELRHDALELSVHGLDVGGVGDLAAEDLQLAEQHLPLATERALPGGEPGVGGSLGVVEERLMDAGDAVPHQPAPHLVAVRTVERLAQTGDRVVESSHGGHLLPTAAGGGEGSFSVTPAPGCDKAVAHANFVRRGEDGFNRRVASDYRLSRPLAARMLGVLLVVLGVVVVALTLLVALLDLPAWLLGVGVLGTAVLVLVAGVVLSRRTTVVRLDRTGYRVRYVRGAGTTEARWTDVEDVVTATSAGERVVVIRLRDGRTTTVPVRMLAGSPDDFVRDLQAHLDEGHGYRRIG